MSKYKHQLPTDVSEDWQFYKPGVWRPSMAHPFYVDFGLRKSKCGCGRKFNSRQDYDDTKPQSVKVEMNSCDLTYPSNGAYTVTVVDGVACCVHCKQPIKGHK